MSKLAASLSRRKFIRFSLWMLFSIMASVGHATNTVTYVYTDPQGTPLAEADVNGTITATFDYTPYGGQALGTAPNGPGYTGHVNDPDTGLVYMQARYYDPSVGRFISTDPVGPSAGDVFTFNRFAYVDNNPVVSTDPTGKFLSGPTGTDTTTEANVSIKAVNGNDKLSDSDQGKTSKVQPRASSPDGARVGRTTVGKLAKTMTNEDGSLSGGAKEDLQNGKVALANTIINNASLKHPASVAPATGKASNQDAEIMRNAYLDRAHGVPDPVEGRTQFGNSTQVITSRSASNGLSGAAGRETVYRSFGPFSNSIGPPTYIYIYNNPGQ